MWPLILKDAISVWNPTLRSSWDSQAPMQGAMPNSWAEETPALWTAEHCCHPTVLRTVRTVTAVTARCPSPMSAYRYHKTVIRTAGLWHVWLSSEKINSPASTILAKWRTTVTTMTLTALSVPQAFSGAG